MISPLAALENPSGSRGNKRINNLTKLGTDSIHGIGYFVWRMPGYIFSKGLAEQLAPRLLGPARQPIRPLKNVIRNGNRCLHTLSITDPG